MSSSKLTLPGEAAVTRSYRTSEISGQSQVVVALDEEHLLEIERNETDNRCSYEISAFAVRRRRK
jgi:hypothetical protein